MRRLILIFAILALGGASFAAVASGDDAYTYFIEADNAFGVVDGSEVKVAGVAQGVVDELFINADKRAVLKVTLSGPLAQLGDDTLCSFEPQSLIAEYFVDCQPKGDPLQEGSGTDQERAENPDIPVEQTRQTVQTDLVQSALRAPYRDRLRILINEFGTALAGNPENLNDAIRRGAPALTETRKVTNLLADQNTIIRDLNANSDRVIGELAERRTDVRKFVEEALDTAAASAERRDDLSSNFAQLDEFLAELKPAMTALNRVAVEQTPLLEDLQASAPGLNTLAQNLPDFNDATQTSLLALGDASDVGRSALSKGRDEIDQLRQAVKGSQSTSEFLADFLRDLDDPGRHVSVDTRANEDTGRKGQTGYTGLEGLLNYVYYQTGAINQFDELGHLLHFSIFEVESGPCASYNADPALVPAADGTVTTDFDKLDRCVAWLGPNQPGINEDIGVGPYDPSVCPEGSTDLEICDPNGAPSPSKAGSGIDRSAALAPEVRGGGSGDGGEIADEIPDQLPGSSPQAPAPSSGDGPADLPGGLEGLLDLPEVGNGLQDAVKGGGLVGLDRKTNSAGAGGRLGGAATRDLLGYLFGD